MERTGTIWLHCDSSSMRAPTYFGLFLHAIFPNQVQEICDKMGTSPNLKMEWAKYSCANRYANICFEVEPRVKEFIEAWQSGGEDGAHSFLMFKL